MIPIPGGRPITVDETALLKEPGYLDVHRKDRIMSDAANGQDNGIGWAVKQMQNGARVARRGWNGWGMWLALQVPTAYSKMTVPYVYMKTADDKLVPWLCSQTDLLAMDWELVAAFDGATRRRSLNPGQQDER
jgi:hypothetical protein